MAATTEQNAAGFRHEAMLYAGEDEFVERVAAFVRDGVEAAEPVLVVVGARKIGLLRERLDGLGEAAFFADMAQVGANPARIIPAWRDFVTDAGPHTRSRGVGEPVFPERSEVELVECQRHESLLNLAFRDTPGFWLLCPYDTTTLPRDTVEEARRSHPYVFDGADGESPSYRGVEATGLVFDGALSEPPLSARTVTFDATGLTGLRAFVTLNGRGAGLGAEQVSDLVLSVNELATNSIRHGGGHGTVRIWSENGSVVCDVTDRGRIADPLAGRVRPVLGSTGGHGLWLVNQLCDLVQIRARVDGTTVRVHLGVRPGSAVR